MKILKIIGISLAGLAGVVLIGGLFVPGQYSAERQVVVNRPVSEVFDYVKYLKNQDLWSVWMQMDPEMEKSYTGTDGTVGFISAWESQNKDVGKGEQEIVAITEGERIDYELRFLEPIESTDDAFLITHALTNSSTEIVWGIEGKLSYPMNLLMLFMNIDEMLAEDLSEGLSNLKTILETAR